VGCSRFLSSFSIDAGGEQRKRSLPKTKRYHLNASGRSKNGSSLSGRGFAPLLIALKSGVLLCSPFDLEHPVQLDRHLYVGVRLHNAGYAPVVQAAPFVVSAILKSKSKSILMCVEATGGFTELLAQREREENTTTSGC